MQEGEYMKHNYIINTNRLKLRQIEYNDLEKVMTWRNQDETRMCFLNSSIITWEQQLEWYKKYLDNDKDIMFIAEEIANTDSIIGTISLYNIDLDNQTAEFGRLIIGDLEYRNKGFGLECTNAICDFGFHQFGLKKLCSDLFEDNIRSLKMCKKAGFQVINTYYRNNAKVLVIELNSQSTHLQQHQTDIVHNSNLPEVLPMLEVESYL